MNLPARLEAKLENGVLSVSYDLKAIVKPKLDEIKADLASGKIDIIHGTSVDAIALTAAIDFLEAKLV